MDYGWLSLIPPLLAILLAFLTREPVFSLAVACLAGVLLMGQGLLGFPELLARSLGNRDFMWICLGRSASGSWSPSINAAGP
jgi:Na+/H+ antiporter NhaC